LGQLERFSETIVFRKPPPPAVSAIEPSALSHGPISFIGVSYGVHADAAPIVKIDLFTAVAQSANPIAYHVGYRRIFLLKGRQIRRHDQISS
jgi:hypothetical protein